MMSRMIIMSPLPAMSTNPTSGIPSGAWRRSHTSFIKLWHMATEQVYAWCVLPNHYHLLVRTKDIQRLAKYLGQLHGRASYDWNGMESARGRKVFHRASGRAIRSSAHFWATVNYIHHNPVHHGYVEKWLEWPWSSAIDYMKQVGRAEAERVWREFPVLDYGKGWDEASL